MREKAGQLAFEGFRLDPANALLWRGDDRVPLPPKPFEVLCCLAAHAGQLVTKEELLDAVWSNLNVSESSLSVSVNALRIALGDDAKAPRYIETIARRGYRFIAPVRPVGYTESAQPLSLAGQAPPVKEASRPRWWVGRQGPLEVLENVLQESVTGNRQTVFVTGEAGIGKTTLVDMFVERISRHGIGLLMGRCIEHFGTDEAFLPFTEALQDYCASADGSFLLKTLRKIAPTWLVQMQRFLDPQDRAALQRELLGATRERMLREFCEFVEVVSADRPWVIIVEDLHWSDYATLDVLSRFARRDQKAPVLVLVTYRPNDALTGGHPARTVLHELHIHGRCRELALGTLSLAEVEQYVALRFDEATMAQTIARRVFRRSGGHPLFVVSLVDYFISQRGAINLDGRWPLAPDEHFFREGMPRDLREMIVHQINRLSAGDQRLLEAASAAGSEFSAATVSGTLELGIPEVEQICEELARRGQILVSAGRSEWPDGTLAGRYGFKHALYQEVLYHQLAPAQRVRLHRRLGKQLEEGYGLRTAEIAAVLALHYEEGRDFAKTVRFLSEAAENSAKRFGNREAAIYLTRALDLVSRLPAGDQLNVRLKLLQQRGRVRRSLGDLRAALEDLQAVVSCSVEAQQRFTEVKALLDLSRFCIWVDRTQCLDLAQRAIERSQELHDDILTALAQANSASLNLYLKGWREEDAERCRRAEKVISKAQDPRIVTRRCGIKSTLELTTSNYKDCWIAANSCQELARERGDVYQYVIYNSFAAFSLLHLGEWRKMRQCVSAALAITEKNANRQVNCLPRLMIGWLHIEALDYMHGRQICEEALDAAVEKNPVNFFLGRNLVAKSSLGLCDLSTAREQFHEIKHRIEVDAIPMDSVFYPFYYHCLCEYFLALGDLAQARREAMRLYEVAKLPPERSYLALSHRLLAEIAFAGGSLDEAKFQLSRAISIVDQGELPLAGWRVYATAAEFHASFGERVESAEFRRRAERIIEFLAENFDLDDPLRSSLLAARAVPAKVGTGFASGHATNQEFPAR